MKQTITYRGFEVTMEDLAQPRKAVYCINGGALVEVECRDFQELELIAKRTIDNMIAYPEPVKYNIGIDPTHQPETAVEEQATNEQDQAALDKWKAEEEASDGTTEGQQEPV